MNHHDTAQTAPADTGLYHHVDSDRQRRPAFTSAEFQRRVTSVQRAMVDDGFDVLLVHSPENICYLTGYETSGYFEYQVLVVPASGDVELLIRNVEQLNVDEHSWLNGAHIWRDGIDYMQRTADIVNLVVSAGRVAIEQHSWFVTAEIHNRLEELLSGHALLPTNRLVERIRLVKSDDELAYSRDAARMADIGMAAATSTVAAGANELAIAANASAAMIEAGSEYPSLPHYIASGHRCELGHANWSDKIVEGGELVKLEFLGVSRRYHAGLTRPVIVGDPPRDVAKDAELCISLQDETFAELRPGASVDQITRDARNRLTAATGREAFKIRVGYSMGIGFPPIGGESHTADFREGAPTILESGMVFHMLSVMRVGLVISDTVVITANGHERLTQSPRRLTIA